MLNVNSEKRMNMIKSNSKNLLKLTSIALLFTLVISLNSNSAEAKNPKVNVILEKQQINTRKVSTIKEAVKSKIEQNKNKGNKIDLSKLNFGSIVTVQRIKKYTNLLVMINPEKTIKGSISPIVLSKSGILVFGSNKNKKNSIAKFIVNKGINPSADTGIAYLKSHAKEKPLIVQSINTINQNGTDFIIISDTDALKILIENQSSNFIEHTKVTFLQNLKAKTTNSNLPEIKITNVTNETNPTDASNITVTNKTKEPDNSGNTSNKEKPDNITISNKTNSSEIKITPLTSEPNPSNITITYKENINYDSSITISNEPQKTDASNLITSIPKIKNINLANPEKYTSVIIDCSKLGLVRAMSPVVMTTDEYELYPAIIIEGLNENNMAIVMNSGLVTYASSIDAAKSNEVAGKSPLIIRASDVKGILNSDAIIDPVDAAKLILLNAKTNILDNRKVILVN